MKQTAYLFITKEIETFTSDTMYIGTYTSVAKAEKDSETLAKILRKHYATVTVSVHYADDHVSVYVIAKKQLALQSPLKLNIF